MQACNKVALLLTSILFLFVGACSEASTQAGEKKLDSLSGKVIIGDTLPNPKYDPSIDLRNVGGAFSKKIDDSLGIAIFEVTLQPGDSLPFHSHPDHTFYLLDSSTVVLQIPGQKKADTIPGFAPGFAFVNGPFTESIKNVGKTKFRWLAVDVHRPRQYEIPGVPAYDSTIDAFTVGGESILKLSDTLGIKMFVVTMRPGDTAMMHSHPDHATYVLEGGEVAVTFQGGRRRTINFTKGSAFVSGPVSDAAKNTGKTTVKLLMTHILRARAR